MQARIIHTLFLLVTVACLLVAPTIARADGDDVVLLTNGGRVRGMVIEDDPQKGVRVQLADGTFRQIPRANVAEVRYAEDAAEPEPAPAPDPAPATERPPLSPAYTVPTVVPPMPGIQPEGGERRRNKGMMISGIVLASVGGAALLGGIGALVVGFNETYFSESSFDEHDCDVDHAFDEDNCTAVGVGLLMVGFGAALAITGVILAPIGAAKVSGSAIRIEPAVVRGGAGVALRF